MSRAPLHATPPIAVVTGAGSGIGAATAELYGQHERRVMVCDIDAQRAAHTVAAIRDAGGQARAFEVDVTSASQVEALFDTIEAEEGPVAELVNNVGIEVMGPTHTLAIADYDRMFNVNVKSVFLCCRAASRHMMERQAGGAIVNLASVASFKTWPGDGVYSATKAAVHALTKAFAVDLAAHRIRVNSVAPAVVDTAMTARAIAADADPSTGRARRDKLHPLGRMAQPLEIAQAIVFLNSAHSAFTTGACLVLDGGLLA